MIRYKVTKENGDSIIAAGTYKLNYKVGETVERVDGTLGLMVFDTLDHTYQFIDTWKTPYNIFTVETYNEYIVKRIAFFCSEAHLDRFYSGDTPSSRSIIWNCPPIGTICCEKVKVLEQIK